MPLESNKSMKGMISSHILKSEENHIMKPKFVCLFLEFILLIFLIDLRLQVLMHYGVWLA